MSSFNTIGLPPSVLPKSEKKNEIQQQLYEQAIKDQGIEDERFKRFAYLASNTLMSESRQKKIAELKKEQEETKKQAEAFISRFSTSAKDGLDEEYDTQAKKMGIETYRPLYINRSNNVEQGYLNAWETSNAGAFVGNRFELMSTTQETMQSQALMAGSNSILQKSKLWSTPAFESLQLTPEQQEQFETFTRRDNNWGRWLDVFDSPEDMAKAIPVVDSIYHLVSNNTPYEFFVSSEKDSSFNAKVLVDAIKEDDPEFASFLVLEGLNLDVLSGARNPGHFRWMINTAIQGNAINRSSMAYGELAPWYEKAYDFTRIQLASTLTSGDMVGQAALTVATMGVGTLATGIATTTNLARGGLTAERTIATLSRLERVGVAANNVRAWLPANIPSTIVSRSLGNAGFTQKAGSWFVLQGVEGFVEEGTTELLNQALDISNYGLRVEYDSDQILYAAGMGALMEPVLGGALGAGTIAVEATISFAGKGANWVTNSVLQIPAYRFNELNLYFALSTKTPLENLSPEEKQIRVATLARLLVLEDSLNRATNNEFGKVEENQEIFQVLYQLLNDVTLSNDPTQRINLVTTIGSNIVEIQNRMNNGEINQEDFVPLSEEGFFQYKDGRVSFTKAGLELLMLTQAATIAMNSNNQDTRIAAVAGRFADNQFIVAYKKQNPRATQEQLQEALEKYRRNEYKAEWLTKTHMEIVQSSLKFIEGAFTYFTPIGDSGGTTPIVDSVDLTEDEIEAINIADAIEKAEKVGVGVRKRRTLPAPTVEPETAPAVAPVVEPAAAPVAAPATAPAAAPAAAPAVTPKTTVDDLEAKIAELNPEYQALVKNIKLPCK